MYFYSTNGKSEKVDFRTATLHGQAPDKGLYFPERIPVLPAGMIAGLKGMAKEEIALQLMHPYIGNCIPEDKLMHILSETVCFPFPLVPVQERISTLELFHGPTLAFKDVGARFMSRCLGYFVQGEKKKVTVLVATSGDTGGAVADGFSGVEGIDVVILYPANKVSRLQELQLTTHGKNITALKIDGSFDDCQQMVKQAFADGELRRGIFLTSANSINVARWLPQQLYYFFALQQWQENQPPVISVPSGNFGNLCAGLLAFRSGLPVQHFVAACNANDVVPRYFQSGAYQPQPSVATLSNAMDVGDPNNFIRLLTLFDQQYGALRKQVTAFSIDDDTTKETIRRVLDRYGYLLDPHGAVGYAALEQFLSVQPEATGFFLETAHPVKFHDVVEPLLKKPIALPEVLKKLLQLPKHSIDMQPDYKSLRSFLLDRM